METIGVILRRLRENAGLSLRELGERSGVPWNTIARLERGEHHEPRWHTIVALAHALDVGVQVFDVEAVAAQKRPRGRPRVRGDVE